MLRTKEPDPTLERGEQDVNLDNVNRAIKVLERPCQKLNFVERRFKISSAHSRWESMRNLTPLARLFTKSKTPAGDDERPTDLGTDAFLTRFDVAF